MKPFRDFEREVVRIFLASRLSSDEVEAVLDSATWASYQYTGSGYYLKVRHPLLPSAKGICDMPLTGRSGHIVCGFVMLFGNHELTLECHTWGPEDVPEDFRERQVEIRVPEALRDDPVKVWKPDNMVLQRSIILPRSARADARR